MFCILISDKMNQHSLTVLEFPKIISLIRGKCLTPFGMTEVDNIKPLSDKSEIERRQQEISQMKDIIDFGNPFPLYRMEDSLELLNKSKVEQNFLEPEEILLILHLINISIEINRYDKEGRGKFPLITTYLTGVRAFPELKEEIERAINDEGDIRDRASNILKTVRSELSNTKRKVISRLEQILSKHTKQAGWQDDIVTLRNDRYVIAVPTHQYRTDMGILHDRSQTGATFYVEPKETVDLNNRINMLYQEERQEIIRILKAITSEIGKRADALIDNCKIIGKLDTVHACARFSAQIDSHRPVIKEEPTFDFINVRHPLLIVQFGKKDRVVPNSISLNDSRQAILITGPNTGGKTVTLKTIGLSILMAQSGLHVAADEKSEIGIFHDIHADIGDEQSIELSLSTFSSHIKNVIRGLDGARSDVLLLFDEIGVGTDPKEGSALAEAIILDALEKDARLIATTHFSQLKTLAMEYPQLENASLEFNRKTLTPTYQLRLGLPGSSYAVEIAGRLGMPDSICHKASSLLSSGEKSLDRLIASVEEELKEITKDRTELSERLKKATELQEYYETQTKHLKKEIESEKERSLAETKSFLEQTRKEIENLVRDIRKSQASEKAVKEFHRKLKEKEKVINQLRDKAESESLDHAVYRSGDLVEIISLHQQGEIEQLIGKDKARIKIGSFFTTVELRNLKKIESQTRLEEPIDKGISIVSDNSIAREIHLRGMTVEEALEKLDRFLDRAVVNGLTQIYVIHGKGSGKLRRTLTEHLKNHPEVASLRLGNWNEGGAGVTIVKLRE